MNDVDVQITPGDCREVMADLPADSVDAVVTDPPYDLTAGKKGGTGTASVALDSPYGRSRIGAGNGAGGFMGQGWDATGVAFDPATWAAALRVLKPGGYLLAFGGTRTWHRLACAIEDAGFEVRDSIAWLYGSGFPKSLNLDGDRQGWGTALKPAFEPVVMARKPLDGTVTANVDVHGTGALNIDGCRIDWGEDGDQSAARKRHGYSDSAKKALGSTVAVHNESGFAGEVVGADASAGRWPANVVLTPDTADELDQQTGTLTSGANPTRRGSDKFRDTYGEFAGQTECTPARGADSGGASRFFYCAKAPQDERPRVDGTAHPTVKPLSLMRWLVRLVTPPGGLVLDPFAGSGTTGEAAIIEGFRALLIEREASYLPLIEARLSKPIQTTLI